MYHRRSAHEAKVLYNFLRQNRELIIARTQKRVASRTFPEPSAVELTHGIPIFLDQLGEALRLAEAGSRIDHQNIIASAGQHGLDLLALDVPIAQVVHDYGDVCQTVTELAVENNAQIPGEEFKTLNLCLDDAIAGAVTEFSRRRERAITDTGTERLGVLAHELRNVLNAALLSFDSIQSGRVAAGGSTGLIHRRSLLALRNLIDRSLAEVRLDAGLHRVELISVAEFVEEVEVGVLAQSQVRDLRFGVPPPAKDVFIEGDRQVLAAAMSNLLHNAFKFTRNSGNISLTTRVVDARVLFEVEDECGGLPPGKSEDLFRPFEQRGADRSGVGLGLSICRKAAKTNHGEIRVRDIPGKGCVFTLDLPRSTRVPVANTSTVVPPIVT